MPAIMPNAEGHELSPRHRQDILDAITRIQWDRSDPDGITVEFDNSRELFSVREFTPGSYTRCLMESLAEYIAGLLGLPED